MDGSSTRVPFMLAGLIALIVNSFIAEPNDIRQVDAVEQVAVTASTKVVMLENPALIKSAK